MVLDTVVGGAVDGCGSALLVRGPPGIGKSALLDDVADRSGDRVRVLRVRGVESEETVAFAALRDLLMPVYAGAASLPAPPSQAARRPAPTTCA